MDYARLEKRVLFSAAPLSDQSDIEFDADPISFDVETDDSVLAFDVGTEELLGSSVEDTLREIDLALVEANQLDEGDFEDVEFIRDGDVESLGANLIPGTGEIQANQNSPLDVSVTESTSKSVRGSDSAVGMAGDGSYVTVWNGSSDVYFQRFNSYGEAVGSAQMVNETTVGDQDDASIEVRQDGSFLIVWESNHSGNNDIYLRQYDADGNPVSNAVNPTGGEYLVHQDYTSGDQKNPDIDINNAGQFSIVWDGEGVGDGQGIYGRTFNVDGTPHSNVFLVNDAVGDQEANASVGIDGSGTVRVVWDNVTNTQTRARVLDFDGLNPGGVQSAPTVFGTQTHGASIATREDGYSAVAASLTTIGVSGAIVVLVGNPDLSYQFNVFDLPYANDSNGGGLVSPSVEFHDDGTILVAWEGPSDSATDNDTYGVYYRKMVAVDLGNGFFEAQTVGAETTINQTTTGAQQYVSLASLDSDNWVAVWSGEGVGDDNGVFVRQYGAPVSLDLDADDSVAPGDGFSATFTSGSGGAWITDVDTLLTSRTGQFDSMTIAISNLLDGAAESLSANTVSTPITQSYDTSTGVLTLSGDASSSEYDQVLRSVIYDNTAATPNTSVRSIAITATNEMSDSVVASSLVSVSANSPPVLDLDSSAAGLDYSATFNAGGSILSVVDSSVNVSDAEGNSFTELVVDISGFVDGSQEEISIDGIAFQAGVSTPGPIATTIGASTLEIQFDGASFTITPTSGTVNGVHLSNLIRTIGYQHVSGTPTAGDRILDFVVQDADGASSSPARSTISVVPPVNNDPVAVDDSYTTNEGTTLSSTLGVDDLLVNDFDPDGHALTVNVTPITDVANGTLMLVGDGSFTYTPDANFTGIDSFVYGVTDGNGGTAQATATIAVSPSPADIVQTYIVPVIDGTVDANGVWSAASANAIELVAVGSTSGPADSSGTWRALWDATNLYLLYEVNDDILVGDSSLTLWHDDVVEFYIDGDLSQGATYDGVDDYHLMFRPTDDAAVAGNNSLSLPVGLQNATQATANGYTTEIAIPWSSVGVTPVANQVIGVEAQIGDDDDGGNRESKLDWHDALDDAWSEPSAFGTAALIPTANNAPTTSPVALTAIAEDSGARTITQAELVLNALDPEGDQLTATGLAIAVGNGSLVDNGDGTWDYTPALDDDTNVIFSYTITDIAANNVAGTATMEIIPAVESIWLTTEQNTTGSGVPGLGSWSSADALQLADPNLTLEPGTSAGTLTKAISFGAFSLNNLDVRGLHYVSRDLSIGGTNSIDLLAGDVLFSTDGDESFIGSDAIQVDGMREDIIAFRPDTPGDYTSGRFSLVFDDPTGSKFHAFTLVEEDTLVGDTVVQAGDLLFATTGGHEVLKWYQTTDVGTGTTSGIVEDLVDGNDLGFGHQIQGIELIEGQSTVAGVSLNAGDLVLVFDRQVSVSGLPVSEYDLVQVSVTATTFSAGSATASANLLFEGADFGFDSTDENLSAVTFVGDTVSQSNTDPTATNLNQTQAYQQGAASESLQDIVVTDPDVGDLITATLTLADTSTGSLSVSSGNGETYDSGTGVWTITGGVAIVNSALAAVEFLPAPANTADTTAAILIVDSVGTSPLIGSIALLANNPPSLVPDGYVINEDTTITTVASVDGVLQNDSDLDGDTLTVNSTPVADVANGTLSLSSDGAFSYTPNANFHGTDSFTYEVSDGSGGTAQAIATITVMPLNDSPVATGENYLTVEDAPLVVVLGVDDLLQNDTDTEGDTLTVNTTPIADVLNGSLTLSGDGTFTYTPNAGFIGSDSFTYEVLDGNGGTAQATADIDVVASGVLVVQANDDSYTITEDQAISPTLSLLDNDSTFNPQVTTSNLLLNYDAGLDADGNASWENKTLVTGYDFPVPSGAVSLDPSVTPTGITRSYVFDGSGNIHVDAFENIPGDPTDESASFEFWIRPDNTTTGTEVVFDAGPFQSGSSLVINKGVGAASLQFTVAESSTGTLTQSTIDISPEFNAGEWIHVVATVDLISDTVTLYATGEDGIQSQAAFTNTADVTDWQSGFFSSAALGGTDGTVAYGSPFGPAVSLANYQGEIAVHRLYDTLLSASDVAQNYLATVSLSSQVQSVSSSNGITVDINGDGTFTYDPGTTFDFLSQGQSVFDSFTYTATESTVTDSALVTIQIDGVNDDPMALGESYFTSEDVLLATSVGVDDLLFNDTDIEGDSLSVNTVALSDVSNGTLALSSDGTFSYMPDADFNGTDSFVYQISDGNGGTAQAVATIVVGPTNDIPSITQAVVDVAESGTPAVILSTSLQASDSDNTASELRYRIQPALPPGILTLNGLALGVGDSFTQADIDSGSVEYSHDSSDVNVPLDINLILEDGAGSSEMIALELNVINESPMVAINNTLALAAGDSTAVTNAALSYSDVDDATSQITYQVFNAPTNGTLSLLSDPAVVAASFTQADIDSGNLVYSHDGGFSTADSFVFVVGDGQSQVLPQTFTIAITGSAPVADGAAFSTAPGTLLSVEDADGILRNNPETLPPVILQAPSDGTLHLNVSDGSFVYIPNAGFVGTDSFIFELSNQFGSDTASVVIQVAPVGANGLSTTGPQTNTLSPVFSDDEPIALPPGIGGPQEKVEISTEERNAQSSSHAYVTSVEAMLSSVLPTSKLLWKAQDTPSYRSLRYSVLVGPQVEDFVTGAFNVSLELAELKFDRAVLLDNLDDFRDRMMEGVSLGEWSVPQGIAITSGLTIGWVLWSLKGGYIVGSLLSATTPTWSFVDPLPVFDSLGTGQQRRREDADQLEAMVSA